MYTLYPGTGTVARTGKYLWSLAFTAFGEALELIAKGSYFGINLATRDLDATFAALEAAGAEIVQEPIDQDYGVRDCAVRDPAGNLIRIQQLTD